MSDIDNLQSEWRKQVIDKLNSLEQGQNQIQKDLNDIRLNYTTATSFNKLQEDVEKLKIYRAKLPGIIIAVNGVAVFFAWLIQSLIYMHH